jgi:hypothetical protein
MTECETCGLPAELCVCDPVDDARELSVGTVQGGTDPEVVVWGFDSSLAGDGHESLANLASHLANSVAGEVERSADRVFVSGVSPAAVRETVDDSAEFNAAEGDELPANLQLADVETVERARREAYEAADLARMTTYGTPAKLRPLLSFEDPETNRHIAEAVVHCGGGPIDLIAGCLSAIDGDSPRERTRRRETLTTLWQEVDAADTVADPGMVAAEVDRYLDDADEISRLLATKSVAALAAVSPDAVRSAIDIGTLSERTSDEEAMGEAAARALDLLGVE